MLRTLKNYLYTLRKTPFHPQWFAYRNESANRIHISEYATGLTLDIGCADKAIGQYLTNVQEHIGLDYYQTVQNWYGTSPDIFGDGQQLPIASNSIDTVLLLDVLEHLPNPDACIAEAQRVLKPGGKALIQVPFIYPLHDEPLDFQRWTTHGLHQLASHHNFQIIDSRCEGGLFETPALLFNIALAKTLLNWVTKKHPILILGILIPPAILMVNTLCWFFELVTPKDKMMPHSYLHILTKPL